MRYFLTSLLLLFASAVWAQDEELAPDADVSSDNNTTCNAAVEASVDDDPDSPGGDWCIADGNNTSWIFTLSFPTPTSALDTATDAQAFQLYVRSFDEGQTGEPTIRADVYDGINCADLHESGTETTLTDAGFPAAYTENWTAAGISAAADVCILVECTKTGGSPTTRNSCDIDALEWEVTWAAAAPTPQVIVVQ